jgi:hypothetical protein
MITSPTRVFAPVRRLAPALILALAPLLGPVQTAMVQAADGACAPSGIRIACTFVYTGAEQTWAVPAGVSAVQVTAVGAPGAAGSGGAGGNGARVTATLAVPAATTTLYVEVGGNIGTYPGFGLNTFNGGGVGRSGGGGSGGGASDVRTCSLSACGALPPAVFSPDPAGCVNGVLGPNTLGGLPCVTDGRLVVAGGGGGGGGGGCATAGGQAGDASVTGAGDSVICGRGGNGGFGGTTGAYPIDGLGGTHCEVYINQSGVISVRSITTSPFTCSRLGGGGGGGFWGGGGGNLIVGTQVSGGGGAGSSFWLPSATNTSMATDTSDTPSVTITYSPPNTTAPTANSSVTAGTPGTNGWYTSDVTVNWNWTDTGGSGIDTSHCTQSSTSTGEGVLTLMATCQDLAGNVGTSSSMVQVDQTRPTISAAATSSPNSSGWYTAPVTVHFTCQDALSGIPAGACPADQLLSADGSPVSSTAGTVSDTAGNTSPPSNVVTVQLDQNPPSVTCAAPDGAWHATDVSLGCTASDATSGLANAAADASFQLSTSVPAGTETATANTSSRSVADVAGNTTTAGPISGNKVDKKAPSISLSQPNGTYLLNEAVTASYSCSDSGSGVATCAGPVSSGAAIDTSSAGTKTFLVEATDAVGNTSSQSVSYTVNYAFGGFLAPVNNPTTVNTGKAGKAYPVKFQLTDVSGAFISTLGAVKSITYQSASCGAFSSDPTDPLETSTTGSSGPQYDSTANQYIYTWATPSTAGCYTLFLTLDGEQVFPAYFNLL